MGDPGSFASAGDNAPHAKGDPDRHDSWDDLLCAHREEVRLFVKRALSTPEDAEDVFQQTLLQAHRGRATFRGENFRAWLFTIARHLIVDHYRAKRRYTFVDVHETGLGNTETALQMPAEMVHGAFESRERLHLCLRCVTRRVTLHQQVALLLADFYGFTDKESATALKQTLPSFKKLLHKARSRLRSAALGVCALVALGDCPLLRGNEMSETERQSAVIRCAPMPAGSGEPPPPDSPEPEALLALRRELLEGLGLAQPPGGRSQRPPAR